MFLCLDQILKVKVQGYFFRWIQTTFKSTDSQVSGFGKHNFSLEKIDISHDNLFFSPAKNSDYALQEGYLANVSGKSISITQASKRNIRSPADNSIVSSKSFNKNIRTIGQPLLTSQSGD